MSNQLSIKEALKHLVDAYRLQNGLRQKGVEFAWREIMGLSIAAQTTELRLVRQTLYIRVNSAPLRQELLMGREKIKSRLNQALNEEAIMDVEIR